MGNRSVKLGSRKPRLRSLYDRVRRQSLDVYQRSLDAYARTRTQSIGVYELARKADRAVVGAQLERVGELAWARLAKRWPVAAHALAERVGCKPPAGAPPRDRAPRPRGAGIPMSYEAIDALTAQLLSSSSWQVRASAAMGLANVVADGVVPALARALRDHSVEVALAAIDALTSQRDEQAITALLGVLENRDGYFSPVTRVAAISALARRLELARFEPVFNALRDIDAEVSIAAVSVIADRVPHRAGALLLPMLRDRTGYYLPIVRLAVANALERAGALHAGVVGELLSHESDPSVQRVLERAKYLSEPAQPRQ